MPSRKPIQDKAIRRAPVGEKAGKLRAIRIERGYSQQDLAMHLKIKQGSISQAERTGVGLTEDNWKKLADLLKSDVLTLRGWKKIFAE